MCPMWEASLLTLRLHSPIDSRRNDKWRSYKSTTEIARLIVVFYVQSSSSTIDTRRSRTQKRNKEDMQDKETTHSTFLFLQISQLAFLVCTQSLIARQLTSFKYANRPYIPSCRTRCGVSAIPSFSWQRMNSTQLLIRLHVQMICTNQYFTMSVSHF